MAGLVKSAPASGDGQPRLISGELSVTEHFTVSVLSSNICRGVLGAAASNPLQPSPRRTIVHSLGGDAIEIHARLGLHKQN